MLESGAHFVGTLCLGSRAEGTGMADLRRQELMRAVEAAERLLQRA